MRILSKKLKKKENMNKLYIAKVCPRLDFVLMVVLVE